MFITGGGSGIGASIVEAFARQGAQVAFVDIADEASRGLADRLAAAGFPRPWHRRCDVTDVPALQQAIADASQELGDFHVLVNNVASDDRHALHEVTPEYWDQRMADQPAAGVLRHPGGGAGHADAWAAVPSSIWVPPAGRPSPAAIPAYATAKSSVNGLTRGLARELGAARIRINVVSPGWVMTERQIALWLDAAGEAELARNQCLPDKLLAGRRRRHGAVPRVRPGARDHRAGIHRGCRLA